MGISSGLGIMAIAKYANKDGIKVLLSGDCADECFGGYSWYPYINQIVENKINNENDSEIFFHNYEYSNEERASIIRTTIRINKHGPGIITLQKVKRAIF